MFCMNALLNNIVRFDQHVPAGLPAAAATAAIAVGVKSFATVADNGVRHIRTFWVFFAAMEILLKIKIGTHNQ